MIWFAQEIIMRHVEKIAKCSEIKWQLQRGTRLPEVISVDLENVCRIILATLIPALAVGLVAHRLATSCDAERKSIWDKTSTWLLCGPSLFILFPMIPILNNGLPDLHPYETFLPFLSISVAIYASFLPLYGKARVPWWAYASCLPPIALTLMALLLPEMIPRQREIFFVLLIYFEGFPIGAILLRIARRI